ncbi:hypothetical protein C7B80_12970 [Cyanosarcina cf. burmensis CCALA 770]|nr:hypothetical protein C7B80_12970 [Cyanosarcina cf. burmensis CCALA 770]
MPVRVTIPIRLRVDPRALTERQIDIEEALAAAVGRALANSRDVVLEPRGSYIEVKFHPLEMSWTGTGLIDISATLRAETFEHLSAVLTRAITIADIYNFAGNHRHVSKPLRQGIAEVFDETRYDLVLSTYTIPAYDKGGAPIPALVKDRASKEQPVLKNDLKRLAAGDQFRLVQLLLTESPDYALQTLNEFAKKNPRKLRQMLRTELETGADKLALIERTEEDFKLVDIQLREVLDLKTKIIEVAQKIPATRSLIQEQELKARGTQRLVGLIDALVEIRQKLQTYLKENKEKTEPSILQILEVFIRSLPRLSAIFLATAGDERTKRMISNLQEDLIENIRWVQYTWERIQDIDTTTSLYRLLYGETAENLDEVTILRAARNLYLKKISENFLPTIKQIAKILEEANSFYTDWRGKVIDKKREKLEAYIKEKLKPEFDKVPWQSTTPYGDSYRPIDNVYNQRYREVRKALSEIEGEIVNLGKRGRDAESLTAVFGIEQRFVLIAIRVQLLAFWYISLQILDSVSLHNIGTDAERKGWWLPIPRRATTFGAPPAVWQPGWYEQVEKLRSEIVYQYDQPDFQTLNSKFEIWNSRIKSIQAEINRAAKREFWITLGITIFATVVTLGVGSAVTFVGGGLLLVTLAEAAAFTLTTNILQSAVLDKPFDPASVVGQFAENALLFGAFRVLNLAVFAGARAIAPGRTLVQMSLIFGTPALLSTGVPLLITRLETGKWPEEISTFLMVNLVLNTAMVLLTRKQLSETLVKLNSVEQRAIITRLQALNGEAEGLSPDLRKFIESGNLSQAEFEAFQARVKKVLPEFETLMKRLSSNLFSDADLTLLGLTRSQVKDFAEMAAKATELISNAKYVPQSKVTSALPAPKKVIDLVETSEGTYEYNPSATGNQPSALIPKFKKVGYDVSDVGGGVLRLKDPKGNASSYLLLPASKPGETTFGRTVLERAVGWRSTTEMAEINTALEQINPNLIKTLTSEFSDETALSALSLLVSQRAKLQSLWKIDAVRGLTTMLDLERGIAIAPIRRLFSTLDEAKLIEIFEKYLLITRNSDVKPGANLLVAEELSVASSVKLIETVDQIRKAGLKLPEGMSRKAMRGLLQLVEENSANFVDKLKEIPLEKRLPTLEAKSPIKDPSVLPSSKNVEILRRHAKDLRPGVNLLDASPEQVLQSLEKLVQPKGGRFSAPDVREDFLKMLKRYRQRIADVQADKNVERNIEGDRNEILAVLAELEKGGEVFSVGAKSKVRIDLALFELPNGVKMTNTPKEGPIQLDVGASKVDGCLVITETTTGELSLPNAFEKLDPQSGGSASDIIDYSKLNLDDASTRKLVQMIKLRAAAKFAKELATAFQGLSGQSVTVELPEMVMQVSKASESAKRAAKALGFKVIETRK